MVNAEVANRRGVRRELLEKPAGGLNRSQSDFAVSRNSAFRLYRRSSSPPPGDARRSAAPSDSSPEAADANTQQMAPFRELRIKIPSFEGGYLASQPNSGSTPSPRADPLPFDFQPLPSPRFHLLGDRQRSFGEFTSPPLSATSDCSRRTGEPENERKSANFREILSLFQTAAQARQPQKRQFRSARPPPTRFVPHLRSPTVSLEEADGSSEDGSAKLPSTKMPRTTRAVVETFSSEDDGIVKDVVFESPTRRPTQRNFSLLKSGGSSLSLSVNPRRPIGGLMASSMLLASPQSDRTRGRSPTGSVASRASDGLFHQMAVHHSATLTFVSESFPQLLRDLGAPKVAGGPDVFQNASLSNIVFKSTSPTLVKDRILLFDAAFVDSTYCEHPIAVLISPAGQYAPLIGRQAERRFGPPVLGEFEELESELRHFLHEAGHEPKPMSSVRIQILPAMNVCSLPSLAAHYVHKNISADKCEEVIAFIMIQLLSALKCLQSDGIEWLSNNFKEFILSYPNPDSKNLLQTMDQLPRLMLLRDTMEEECVEDQQLSPARDSPPQHVGICRFALRALCTLLNRKIQGALPEIPERTRFSNSLRKCAELLNADRSSSMTEAKQVLELAFFAGGHPFESEFEAKLWLDDRRAQHFLLTTTPRALLKTTHLLRRK
ncbi:hypothetical protein M3Y99_01193800 [Aphelenchoides fujianensis]|nr:hypothetical protein M3Y99_01193800 [Aphelenchoides fujianensis]